MATKQYRIMKLGYTDRDGKRYKLVVTHGLMDVETLGWYVRQADARTAAKRHAERAGVTPIILT